MHQLVSAVSTEIEIKKSRFIGQLFPCTSRADAKIILNSLRVAHPNAVHVCWVLICDGDSGLDDDGEPSGTAAKPMYNVLVHKQLHNVLAVVVRYWGGIKLGAGGLTRAYSQAISHAFQLAELKVVESREQQQYQIPFSVEAQFRHLCDKQHACILSTEYADGVILTISVLSHHAEQFTQDARNLLRADFRVPLS